MPHALLLSPDDQAVSAITGVLEELSVTCERPLDGLSAAQKLNSQSFDLVLVDCENLPAAKLIFDVCRRGKDGNTPVPIAIVDGRAGLPTAFRLGAELILTKPVAKDQARTTIRTAVGRVRKDKDAPGEADFTPAISSRSVGTPLERALAAAAGAGSVTPQLTSYADDDASFVSSVQAKANVDAEGESAIAAGVTPKAQAAVESDVAPRVVAPPAKAAPPVTAAPLASTATPAVARLKSSAAAIPSFAESFKERTAASQKAARPHIPSDDPVLAEIEQTELGELEPQEPQPEPQSKLKTADAEKAAKRQAAAEHAPVFSSYQHSTKPRGALVGVLGLTIAAAGFYGVWMYQPGFKEIAGPQINRVLALAGMAPLYQAPPPSPGVHPTNAAPRPAVATAPVAATPNQTTSASASSAADSAATPAAGTSAQATPTSTPASAPASSATATPSAIPVAIKPVAATATKAVALKNDLKNDNSEANKKDAADDSPLPGESTAIILSSKGAEKRLAHSVPAKYPAGAVSGGAQGTLVLKEVVDENGKVAGVKLVEGDPALASAAIKAVKQWRYRPYMRDGRAQPFQTVVIMDFQRP